MTEDDVQDKSWTPEIKGSLILSTTSLNPDKTMSLYDEIKQYINELENLLTVTPEQALIDKARALWGKNDVRYEVLELLEDSERFNTQSAPIESESTDKSETNKPIR